MEKNVILGARMSNDEIVDLERARLDEVSEWYSSSDGFYSKLVEYNYLTYKPFLDGASILELGCSDGLMTSMLIEKSTRYVAVDGSKKYCDHVRKIINDDRIEVVCSLFEDLELNEKFDVVIMSHVVEHVVDPVGVMMIASKFLKDRGRILVTVPNADSLHRKAGVIMGLLETVTQLNELDIKLGHRRVYNWEKLLSDITDSGLLVEHRSGIFLKPISNSQINESWNVEMMDAYYQLGLEFPEIAAEIFVVLTKGSN